MSEEKRYYEHAVTCSGDRTKPPGTKGVSCSCRILLLDGSAAVFAKAEPAPPTDPLEEALAEAERDKVYFIASVADRALAAIRVLKRGHVKWEHANECLWCNTPNSWPCPILAEAAEKLRGK